ncbi:hypothetical protein FRC12_014108 [Ceratobasidium sp. 428]|nr:hypothetical protein FRC12_014108 [Ceratobasidium sp. 428]
MTPINVLPSELFSRIFSFVTGPTLLHTKLSKPHPLLVLTAVCTQWRQIAIGTSSLWTHIQLPAPPPPTKDSSYRTEYIRLWLERAQGAPLHIYVLIRAARTPDNQHYLSQLLCTLQPHVAHLKSLVFPVTTNSIVYPFLALCSRYGVPGSLKSLAITSYREEENLVRQSWPTVYLQSLVSLQLSGLPEHMSLNFDELSAILSASPALQTLRLRNTGILPGHALAISLPDLQVLDVRDLDRDNLLELLHILFVGKLELNFRLSLGWLAESDVVDAIVPFCRRSNVVSLWFTGSFASLDHLVIALLSCLSSLRVLALYDGDGNFHAADNMIDVKPGGKTPRCKKLHTLYLKSHTGISKAAESHINRLLEVYSLHTIVLERFAPAPFVSDPAYSEDKSQREEHNAEFLNGLARKVQSVVADGRGLSGSDETVDLYIHKLITESGVNLIGTQMAEFNT